jgi:tetratricopeptide (TPR) repeat protein
LVGYFISSYPGSNTIPAWYNYWERLPATSNIDASYPLPSDINPVINQGYIYDDYQTEIESGLLLKRSEVTEDKPIEQVPGIEELDGATKLLSNKKYDEALPEMHKLVEKYKDGFVGKRALVFIENILTETDRTKEILPMLNSYSIGDSKVAQFAEYRKGYQYFHLGEYDKGIEIMKGIEFNEEDADLKQARLYDLGVAYNNLLDQKEEAYNYFNELVRTYPDCQLAKIAIRFYDVTKDGYEKPPEGDKEVATVTETKLFANYPNPFNPSTIIKYQLSDASQVSLKVYDIMGREVVTLVNSFQNKGSYNVTFNANGLSSGIYFYKLNAGEKQLINKMLLIK